MNDDYASLVTLCRNAVGHDDYVIPILRRMITSHSLFMALDGQRVIGITNYQKTLDGSGWLSSARTDPEYRGRRVAGFLQESITSRARKQGVSILRLWINKSNSASIKAAVRGGFHPVSEMIHSSIKISKASRPIRLSRFENPSSQEISEILNSNYLKRMNGFFAYYWQLVKSSEKVIRLVAKRGELFKSIDGDVFFFPKDHEIWGRTQHNEFAPLKGPLNRSLEDIEKFAPSIRAGSIGSFLPYNQYYVRVASARGYLPDWWGTHCILFEKAIM